VLFRRIAESSDFLKKSSKNLHDPKPALSGTAEAEKIRSFLLLFFKKEDLPSLSARRPGTTLT
jgi:hypothetical protein